MLLAGSWRDASPSVDAEIEEEWIVAGDHREPGDVDRVAQPDWFATVTSDRRSASRSWPRTEEATKVPPIMEARPRRAPGSSPP
jgi:hypothetical protein